MHIVVDCAQVDQRDRSTGPDACVKRAVCRQCELREGEDKTRAQVEEWMASDREPIHPLRLCAEVANFVASQAIAEQQGIANRKRAEAEMAYDLQRKTMEISVQEQEIVRREKELDATIRRQADAKRYEIETIAADTGVLANLVDVLALRTV